MPQLYSSQPRAFDFDADHPAMKLWLGSSGIFARMMQMAQRENLIVSRMAVLLPFAQQLHLVKRTWMRYYPGELIPKFETTLSLCGRLSTFVPSEFDYTPSAAFHSLTIKKLFAMMGIEADKNGHDGTRDLEKMVLTIAKEIAPTVAATLPQLREKWLNNALLAIDEHLDNPFLVQEQTAAQIAINWIGRSEFLTDALYQNGLFEMVDKVVMIEGAEPNKMAHTLQEHWGDRVVLMPLAPILSPEDEARELKHRIILCHPCQDVHHEIDEVAACVVAKIEAGHYPVAIVSSDRAMTRQLIPLLQTAGVALRDENGWKLSTSAAGGQVMAMVRAMAPNVGVRALMILFKTAPNLNTKSDLLEAFLAKNQHLKTLADIKRKWQNQTDHEAISQDLEQIDLWSQAWARDKSISSFLLLIGEMAHSLGLWASWEQSNDGLTLKSALFLEQIETKAPYLKTEGASAAQALMLQTTTLSADEFRHWLMDVLEATNYQDDYPVEEMAALLPMSQTLGRAFASMVLMGCDEKRLPPAPASNLPWPSKLSEVLGLPTCKEKQLAQTTAWRHALDAPVVDIFWRKIDQESEEMVASPLLLLLQLEIKASSLFHEDNQPEQPDSFIKYKNVPGLKIERPATLAPASLLAPTLSANSYDDLRQCPYRFFAKRMLGLKDADEIEVDLSKKDFGTWIHDILHVFHEENKAQKIPPKKRKEKLNEIAQQVTKKMKRSDEEFLPFESLWEGVRDHYLAWLERHEKNGWRYQNGEINIRNQLIEGFYLTGRIDRIDVDKNGESVFIIDYKTSSESTLKAKVKDPLEDTQMRMYGLMQSHQNQAATLQTVYLPLQGKAEEPITPIESAQSFEITELFRHGLLHDLKRIQEGVLMPALGHGFACDHCNARGVCQKDFWWA